MWPLQNRSEQQCPRATDARRGVLCLVDEEQGHGGGAVSIALVGICAGAQQRRNQLRLRLVLGDEHERRWRRMPTAAREGRHRVRVGHDCAPHRLAVDGSALLEEEVKRVDDAGLALVTHFAVQGICFAVHAQRRQCLLLLAARDGRRAERMQQPARSVALK